MACSVYGAQYLLEGLYKNNEATYAKKLIVDKSNKRTWWNMIEVGSTMTLESWNIKVKPNLDWNHAWGTAPLNIISRNMWGIKPTTPGFCTAEMHPQLGRLKFSEITVPTIKGKIIAKFKELENGNQVYEIKFPKTILLDFILLRKKYKEIIINGRNKKYKEKIRLKKTHNIIEIKY
jgi:hypothetical protein